MTPDFEARSTEIWTGGAVLELAGEIDLSTAPMVDAQFESLADRGITDVVIDATQVTFMDSSGLAALLAGQKLIHSKGSSVLVVPSPQVRRLLELLSNEPLVNIEHTTVEGAIASLEQRNV